MIKKLKIWGRLFDVNIDFELYPNETESDEQINRLNEFLSHTGLYSDTEFIEKYCLSENGAEIGERVENIFKYVIPKSLYIPKKDTNKMVALLCDYRFDIEHGIAVVYENNKFSRIVLQDDVL